MKKASTYFLYAFVVMLVITACSSDEKEPVTAPVGTWRITKYSDHTKDQTNHFKGYNFTFGNDDVLTANNGTNTYTGIWSVTNNASGSDDSPEDAVDFNIAFTTPPDFEDISDDWDIISRTDTKIELVDDKTDASKVDYLTFEKN